MTTLIEAETRLEAWMTATEHLLVVESELNLILAIQSPESDGCAAAEAMHLVDDFYSDSSESAMPLHTVAETIFPGWEYAKRGLRGVYDVYADGEYPAIHRSEPQRWGTYAFRLLRRQNADGEIVNPLETMIGKMSREAQRDGGAKKSCYEIGIAEGEYDLPLYNTVDDQGRVMGGPCLSHLSFKLFNGAAHLTAFYRSHDYRHKALGNLLGLARLQACVASEVGVGIGQLVVHSSYAYLRGAKGRLRTLLTGLNDLRG